MRSRWSFEPHNDRGEQALEETVLLNSPEEARMLFGNHDEHLRTLRDAFGIRIVARKDTLKLEGDDEGVADSVAAVEKLLEEVREKGHLSPDDVDAVIAATRAGDSELFSSEIEVFVKGKPVRPRSPGQARYIDAMAKHDLVFCIGPAGTGKTYLAVAAAISGLRSGLISKIVLARPAVEAGERLGFLPGDMHAKVNPYLRPLYDALGNMMEFGQIKKYLDSELIEILPLAFMRGRTLGSSFVILDEAQNCTVKQMKTFLTRLGVGSKIVVTGDITQIDLEDDQVSGLVDVQSRLRHVSGVKLVQLTSRDIVRHRLVADIVSAYDRSDMQFSEDLHGERQ